MESLCSFTSGDLVLEGLYEKQAGEKAVVITHPHPLLGGDMDNPVVQQIKTTYRDKGYASLCFNFRGVGRSQGVHDHGRGEKNDVIAALSFLKDQGYSNVDLAGYSFGAYVNLGVACECHDFNRVVLVSPPVDFMDFGDLAGASSLYMVLTGSDDTYASPAHIKKLLKNWNKNAIFIEIPGADHFYSGNMRSLDKYFEEYL